MKRLRKITAAEGNEDIFKDTVDGLKDDFEYVLSGLDKLQRYGVQGEQSALEIARGLSDAIQSAISSIADDIE